MTTDTGMWRPNGIAQARRFATFDQQMDKLRVTAKWYAFQARRADIPALEKHWTLVAEAHAAAIAEARAWRTAREAQVVRS